MTTLIMAACTDKIGNDTESKEIPKTKSAEFTLTIVTFEEGYKHGRWPRQSCDYSKKRLCCRWFPADNTSDVEQYMGIDPNTVVACGYVEGIDDNTVSIVIPKYSELTGIEYHTNIEMFGQEAFEIPNEIKIYDEFAINSLALNGSAVIPAGTYPIIDESDYYRIDVPIEYKEDDMLALVYFPLSTDGTVTPKLDNFPISDWWFGYDSPDDITPSDMPVAIIREMNGAELILEFCREHQT